MRLFLIVGPDFGGTAAFHDHHDLFVHVALGIECAGARHLDDVASPLTLGAEELDERAVAAHAIPALERHVLHTPHADAAKDRNPLGFHVVVIRGVWPLPGAVAGVLVAFR